MVVRVLNVFVNIVRLDFCVVKRVVMKNVLFFILEKKMSRNVDEKLFLNFV